jgi:threonine aldolase
MAEAEVGDDVFGEDPSINRLQQIAAEILDKEAALFVPSGTMANQICLRLLTKPGDEVICHQWAHLYRFEGSAAQTLSGLSFFPIPHPHGILTPELVKPAILESNIHFPVSKVLALENTSNKGNGAVYPLENIKNLAELAQENGLHMHLDGARMFNACVAGGYSPKDLAAYFDTISFCLSKGLGAPVGSIIVSTRANIEKAIRIRKRLGGGMRQAGFLAAAGIFALENNIDRLARDHERAQKLAQALAEMPGVTIDPREIQTNIVIFDITPSGLSPDEALRRLGQLGLGVVPFGGNLLRAVLHLEISDPDLDQAISILQEVFQ